MHVSVRACASRKPLDPSGAGKVMDLQPLLSWAHKWCFNPCSITCQGVKSIMTNKLMFYFEWAWRRTLKTGFLPASAASKAKPHTRGFEGPSGKKCSCQLHQSALSKLPWRNLPEIPVNNKDLLMFHNYFPKYLIAASVPNTRNWQILNTQ